MGSCKYKTSTRSSSLNVAPLGFSNKADTQSVMDMGAIDCAAEANVDIDLKEVYLLITHFLSGGPCQRAFGHLQDELLEHKLLPRRYHSWFSRTGASSGYHDDDGTSFPLSYNSLVERYPHIAKDHLVKLLKQLMLGTTCHLQNQVGVRSPNAADVPTILGSGSFSLLNSDKTMQDNQVKCLPLYLRWPHIKADQVRGLNLREIGGGFNKHHRAPSIRAACYAIAKPATMVQKMQNIKKLRGHRNAVYCAIFDRSGRYVITGSDDRLVKIWSMETAFCLASCRGHEGDITDLAVSSNNALVASASNDFVIRVWRLPDGLPISVLRGHTGAVTTIAFSPKPSAVYQLLSSSDDGTCRIWDARYSQCNPRIYLPKPSDAPIGKNNTSNLPSSSNRPPNCQILCCAYNANGTVFVTGSSDTFARVWSAPKSNPDGSEEPIHEMDLLSGHENDVNYVQFSGCSVASKFSSIDASKEENLPKFKNSWFCHDNIVTCSRDGSAIIWVPRSRRSHGKSGHWIRAYHLKVPPPPLPPQPPLGRSRQRFLPTPRGVNMIIWSLDNRFVLAAIMDCRICVWNAVDGSLVHSLTGHTASSYVLDVHPFNPRIAMSAGYDGQTIVWDIWEGVPIRIYEIGRFKLVDGKFSPDGTSIVLSDDVGQIYLLNTGQGESQKDAKYDQFFLGDYRPLIRDVQGNVLDQDTQLAPHRRNIQDPLCDASMVPYPEPYQSQFQQRRLGALNIEWRPSSIKYAIGPDVSLGLETQMLPLADLERMFEPQPEFIDAMYWEPENEVFSDDADSEYNVTEENSSGGEQGSSSISSSSDSECSEEDSDAECNHKDSFRRSSRKRLSSEVDSMNSSGRRVKKRTLAECHGAESRSNRKRRAKCGKKPLKRESSRAKASRPQRTAARNARNVLSQYTGMSSNEDDDESGYESLDSLQEEQIESEREMENIPLEYERSSLEEYTNFSNNPVHFQPAANSGNKRLIIKFSGRDAKKNPSPGDTRLASDRKINMESQSSRSGQTTNQNMIAISSVEPLSLVDSPELELNQGHSRNDLRDDRQLENGMRNVETSNDKDAVQWEEEAKICTYEGSRSAHVKQMTYTKSEHETSVIDQALDVVKHTEITSPGSSLVRNEVHGSNCELKGKNPLRFTIKKKGDSEIKSVTALKESAETSGDANAQNASIMEPTEVLEVAGVDEAVRRSYHSQLPYPYQDVQSSHEGHQRDKSMIHELSPDGFGSNMDARTSNLQDNHGWVINAPGVDKKLITRARSTRNKSEVVNHANLRSWTLRDQNDVGTSKVAESYVEVSDHHSQRSKSSKKQPHGYLDQTCHISSQRRSADCARKPSWLMLLEQEQDYRYIPQLGDKVVYLRQGHQELIESQASSDVGPWRSIKGLNAVEICKVEELNYATVPGSGDSCCKIKLKIVDPSSSAHCASFELTLPDLRNFAEFVVEKARYDAAITMDWGKGDKCMVWWRDEDNEGGRWWEGEIVSSEAKSQVFLDSPWERYTVRYVSEDSGEKQLHSPWELHHPEISWQNPHIDHRIRDKLLSYFKKLEHSMSRVQDKYGIQALGQVADRSEFRNRFPVPLYPELIHARLENDYYRSLEAVEHDVSVMLSNAQTFFSKNERLLKKIKRLSKWLAKKLRKVKSH